MVTTKLKSVIYEQKRKIKKCNYLTTESHHIIKEGGKDKEETKHL